MWDEIKDRPLVLLLLGVGVPLCIWALSFVVRGAIAGVGLAISAIHEGFVGAVASAPWIAPAASICLAGAGLSLAGKGIVVIVQQSQTRPFDFATAVLGVLSALSIGVAKEYGLKNMPLTALLLAVATGMAVAVGGALLKSDDRIKKVIGFVFPLIPALVIAGQAVSKGDGSIVAGIHELTPSNGIAFVAFLLSSIVLAILANREKRRS